MERNIKLILLCFLLSGNVLSAQTRYVPHDTVHGRYASYVVEDYDRYSSEGEKWILIRNINNRDTATVMQTRQEKEHSGNFIVEAMRDRRFHRDFRIEPAFRSRLTPSEIKLLTKHDSKLIVEHTINDDGTIREVRFAFPCDNPVWQSISPDRYYAIERAVIGSIEPHENDYPGRFFTSGLHFYDRAQTPMWVFGDTETIIRRLEIEAVWEDIISEIDRNMHPELIVPDETDTTGVRDTILYVRYKVKAVAPSRELFDSIMDNPEIISSPLMDSLFKIPGFVLADPDIARDSVILTKMVSLDSIRKNDPDFLKRYPLNSMFIHRGEHRSLHDRKMEDMYGQPPSREAVELEERVKNMKKVNCNCRQTHN